MSLIKVLLIALMVVVAGCSSDNAQSDVTPTIPVEPPNLTGQSIPATQMLTADWDQFSLKHVAISRSQRFGSVSPILLGTFIPSTETAPFVDAFRTAHKIDGQLNARKPDYDLAFVTDDGRQEFHLWLGQQKGSSGMYTEVSDTGTGYTLSIEAADQLRELIRALPYTSEQAENNGDVVNMHGKIKNLEKWAEFMEHVASGTPDEVHVTSYTIEGDPIFQDLLYDGKSIEFSYDNSMDAFGTPRRGTAFCKGIDQQETKQGTQYTLTECDRAEPAFYLMENS